MNEEQNRESTSRGKDALGDASVGLFLRNGVACGLCRFYAYKDDNVFDYKRKAYPIAGVRINSYARAGQELAFADRKLGTCHTILL